MGRIIFAKASEIRPDQFEVEADSLELLINFFKDKRHGLLLPPAVRDYDGYVCIDGNHRFLLAGLFDVEMAVYVAENKDDFMNPKDFPNIVRGFVDLTNDVIGYAFDKIPKNALKAKEQGIASFADLRVRYGLTSIAELEKFIAEYRHV